jgi:hypothetical protein
MWRKAVEPTKEQLIKAAHSIGKSKTNLAYILWEYVKLGILTIEEANEILDE